MTEILRRLKKPALVVSVQIFTTIQISMPGNQVGDQIYEGKMKANEIDALGNILNTSWGKSSSPGGQQSIKCVLAGDRLTIKYVTIVHFGAEQSLQQQVGKHSDEARQKIDAALGDIKSQFKTKTGRALKTKDEGGADNVELISSTVHSLRKVAYYHVNRVFTLT